MKIRNKKTGEVEEFNEIYLTKTVKETNTATSEYVERSYYGIDELNEEWEDYKPKEPLIKDEKIRKAVRAWANSFDDVDEIKASDDYKEFWIDGYLIEFERPFDEVESEHTYRRTNIIELCGEEEE